MNKKQARRHKRTDNRTANPLAQNLHAFLFRERTRGQDAYSGTVPDTACIASGS